MCLFKKLFYKKPKFPFPKGWTIPKDKNPMDVFWDFWY